MKEAYYLVDNFKVEKVVFNGGEYNELELGLISLLKEKNISYEKAPDVLKMGEYKLQFLNTGIYDNENDTVGIIVCKKNNQYVINYCIDKKILSREYELV